MDGLESFKRIFAFLMAQVVLLIACGGYLAYVAVHHLSMPDLTSAATTALVLGAVVLIALRLAWPMAAGSVELFWGTSVKIHVERLMQPALLIGAVALAAAAFIFAISDSLTVALLIEGLLTTAAIGLPLVISLLLLFSAYRRMKAYRRGHAMMTETQQQFSNLERVNASIASEQGLTETSVRPDPQGFTFAGLTSRPWHDASNFPWVAAFEDAVDEITEEFLGVSKGHEDAIHAYKYAGLEGEFWQSFQLVTRHRELAENSALCPRTSALLKTIPHYPGFRDAMFSILDGGGVISPHRDVSNVFLTMHLPLIAPGNGFMEVGGLRREWRRGEAMIFDSSYHHQAQNNADGRRVVLLVDFLHPELTDEEAAWVSASRL